MNNTSSIVIHYTHNGRKFYLTGNAYEWSTDRREAQEHYAFQFDAIVAGLENRHLYDIQPELA